MKRILYLVLVLILLIVSVSCTNGNDNTKKQDIEEQEEKIDLTKFPNYVEADEAEYKFDFEEIVTPYWKGNVIYNETVLLIDDGNSISGKLQYEPIKILSVRDYTWETEYSLDKITVNKNTIKIEKDSGIPYLTEENLEGISLPEKYREVSTITRINTDWVMMGATIYTESDLYYGHQV